MDITYILTGIYWNAFPSYCTISSIHWIWEHVPNRYSQMPAWMLLLFTYCLLFLPKLWVLTSPELLEEKASIWAITFLQWHTYHKFVLLLTLTHTYTHQKSVRVCLKGQVKMVKNVKFNGPQCVEIWVCAFLFMTLKIH